MSTWSDLAGAALLFALMGGAALVLMAARVYDDSPKSRTEPGCAAVFFLAVAGLLLLVEHLRFVP